MALSGSCRAHYVPSTTENRGQQTLLSTSQAIHKPPAHHTFGLLNTPVDNQPVSDSQAEYAGSIIVIRSISPGRRLAGSVTSAILVHHSAETGCSPGSPMTESNDSSR